MDDRIKEVMYIIKEHYYEARFGIFCTTNICGDEMDTIHDKDGVRVDICYRHEYFEVFGLNDAEYEEVENYYYYDLARWYND